MAVAENTVLIFRAVFFFLKIAEHPVGATRISLPLGMAASLSRRNLPLWKNTSALPAPCFSVFPQNKNTWQALIPCQAFSLRRVEFHFAIGIFPAWHFAASGRLPLYFPAQNRLGSFFDYFDIRASSGILPWQGSTAWNFSLLFTRRSMLAQRASRLRPEPNI